MLNSKKSFYQDINLLKFKQHLSLVHRDSSECSKIFKKLPFILIKQKKCRSTKNLVSSHNTHQICGLNNNNNCSLIKSSKNIAISTTCEINRCSQQMTGFYINNIYKINKISKTSIINKINKKKTINDIEREFTQSNRNVALGTYKQRIKKYSSCNKLVTLTQQLSHGKELVQQMYQNKCPSTSELQLNLLSQNQLQIRSTNSIKLLPVHDLKRQYLQKLPFKRILKSTLSRTINPGKVQSQNSIQLQNQQKTILRKQSKASRDKIPIKTKILVKNPFDKIIKRKEQEAGENILAYNDESRLSRIFEDGRNESQVSSMGREDIHRLIKLMQ